VAAAEPKGDDPVLLAGKLQGVRSWSLLSGGASGAHLLTSLGRQVYWPPGSPLRAACETRRSSRRHSAPRGSCSCGIYAWHPCRVDANVMGGLEEALEPRPWPAAGVVGVIEAWGRTEVHADGFRAEYARPVSFAVSVAASHRYRDGIRALAGSYGANLVEVASAEDFVAYCRALPNGLDERMIGELVVSRLELRLTHTASCAWVSQRRQAVAASGYVLEGQEREPTLWQQSVEVELPGVQVMRVAGAKFHPHALQDPAFAPARPLRLLPEPHNHHDRNALGVWDRDLRLRAGYIPAEFAPQVGQLLREGRLRTVRSLWQWRDLASGKRIGLHLLLSETDRLVLEPGPKEDVTIDLSRDDDLEW
jgi:hypothetical protein